MGRYDFRPIKVLQHANQLLDTSRVSTRPPWARIVAEIPPSESIVRPVKRFDTSAGPRKSRNRKSSRMFQPLQIMYPEDKMRTTFFNDHPWELARPRTVIENDGNDARLWDWSKIEQPGKPLDGESVVRRQLWLKQHMLKEVPLAEALLAKYDKIESEAEQVEAQYNEVQRVRTSLLDMNKEYEGADFKSEGNDVLQAQVAKEIEALDAKSAQLLRTIDQLSEKLQALNLTEAKIEAARNLVNNHVDEQTIEERAYDQARKEFYALRLKQDVERQIAREEATHYGSYFEPTANEKSLKFEDDAIEDWKEWALKDIEAVNHKNASMISGGQAEDGSDSIDGGIEPQIGSV